MAKVSVRIRKPVASAGVQPADEIRQVEEGSEIEVNEGETVEEMEDPPVADTPAEPVEEPMFRLASKFIETGADISPTAPPIDGDPQHVVVAHPEPVHVVNETAETIHLHVLNEGARQAPPVDRSRHRVR